MDSRPLAHATVRAARVRFHSDELGCEVWRGIGYDARCKCGWRGPIRRTLAEARADAKGHACPSD